MLEDKVIYSLQELYQEMRSSGEILSTTQLDRYLALFREKFGPDRLANLDGPELLYTLHALRKDYRDSLVYWLEFKNDDEFPSRIFGSISGGSALKFGIYQRKEDGVWMTGSPQKQIEISEEQAIDIARRHRQQFLDVTDFIYKLPMSGAFDDYQRLQEQIDEIAPDIGDSAWAHKYFHLLFPAKLDNFHVRRFQQFHLIKLLLNPPKESGRYVAAAQFVSVSRQLQLPMNHLAMLLNKRNGRPYRYWRIGTSLGGKDSRWTVMRDHDYVAIGWPDLGDLSHVSYNRSSKESIREKLEIKYPNIPQVIGKKTQEIFNFVAVVDEGDLVLASQGAKVLGIGRVVGEYVYSLFPDDPAGRI
jgi:5-methylcytosine-specific restriction protein B